MDIYCTVETYFMVNIHDKLGSDVVEGKLTLQGIYMVQV